MRRRIDLPKRTFNTLMRRLAAAGFKGSFVREAVMPDWWTDECASDPDLLPDLELRVARFVEVPLRAVQDPAQRLVAPAYAGVRLRRVHNVDKDRLAPAIHAAHRIAGAVVRCMREAPDVRVPSASVWRSELANSAPVVKPSDIISDLWSRGVPVIHVDLLPRPSFQGLACVVTNRPVIVLSHAFDDPARLAFVAAHEAGHIANGDCTPDHPVVDHEDETADDDEMERHADRFASEVLVDGSRLRVSGAVSFKDLATLASDVEKRERVEAGALIWSWARDSGAYAKANMAVRALYRHVGGRRMLRHSLEAHVDLESASESDSSLLRCLYGDPGRDAAAD